MNIFEYIETRPGMVRRDDPSTSIEAAEAVAPGLTKLQARVLAAFKDCPMTDEQLERLPEFSGFAPSTIRKRRSELYQDGYLVNAGTAENSRGRAMIVWKIA